MLRRKSGTSSSSSCSSMMSTAASNSSSTNGHSSIGLLPRRRLTPAQLSALSRMFEIKTHPTKEERIVLAHEIGMEVKTVSIWFQNKRQASKRSASILRSSENNHGCLSSTSISTSTTSDTSSRKRPSISLNHIASLSEHPVKYASSRQPLTPRKTNRYTTNVPAESQNQKELWNRIPSSPIAPLSSPTADCKRILILPSRSKSFRSLEWACANARAGNCGERTCAENGRPSEIQGKSCVVTDEGREQTEVNSEIDMETDVDEEIEAVTPDRSSAYFPRFGDDLKVGIVRDEWEINTPKSESGDVAAAMLLLGFMGQS